MRECYGCKVNRVLMAIVISFAIMYSVNDYLGTLTNEVNEANSKQAIRLLEYSLELNDERFNKAVGVALNDDVITSGEIDSLIALYKKIKLDNERG